jgi:hypothetical protein
MERNKTMRSVRKRSFRPEISGLEGRQLLSTMAGSMARHAPAAAHVAPMNHGGMPEIQAMATPDDTEVNGIVIQTPRFYEHYVGQKLAQLEAKEAVGQLVDDTAFGFAGVNVGVINPNVRATYVFGIDRSGRLPTGPFPDRPNIRFDATVVIKLVPGHSPTVTVNDLARKKTTTLPNTDLLISKNIIAVGVPENLLPSTGLRPAFYRYAYWPEDGQMGATHIASFAPDFHDIQVGVNDSGE